MKKYANIVNQLTAQEAREIIEKADEERFYLALRLVYDTIHRNASAKKTCMTWTEINPEIRHYIITNLTSKENGYKVTLHTNRDTDIEQDEAKFTISWGKS